MIPAQFKEARHKLGLSVSQLGAILDTEPRTIRRWEDGSRSPNPVAVQVMRWMMQRGRPREWPSPQEDKQ